MGVFFGIFIRDLWEIYGIEHDITAMTGFIEGISIVAWGYKQLRDRSGRCHSTSTKNMKRIANWWYIHWMNGINFYEALCELVVHHDISRIH